MPRRGERKITQFAYRVEGQEIVVPVWVVDGDKRTFFRAIYNPFHIELEDSDIDHLRVSVQAEVDRYAKLDWKPYLYIHSKVDADRQHASQSTTIEGYLIATTADGTELSVRASSPNFDDDLETLMSYPWTDKFAHPPQKGRPKTGPFRWNQYSKGPNDQFGALLPADATSYAKVKRLIAENRASAEHLLTLMEGLDDHEKPVV